MVTNHRRDNEGGKGKKTRGTAKNKARLAAFGKGSKRGAADWATCNMELLQVVVVAITGLGGAVTFGLSRDGGSHMLKLMLDGDSEVLWYNGDATLTEELTAVADELEAMLEEKK